MAPFENLPGDMIVVIGFFSKREYAYLAKAGYKAAQRMKTPKRHESRPAQVHISREFSPISDRDRRSNYPTSKC